MAATARPSLPEIVLVEGVGDVIAAVERAGALGLGLAVTTTGEVAGRALEDRLVVDVSRLVAVGVDAEARVARVGGGATWAAVLAAAHPLGLAPVAADGIASGVVGGLLAGSPGWLARAHGAPGAALRHAEVVTPSGLVVRTAAGERPELAPGIVTAATLDLVPVAEVYAGDLRYPAAMAPEVGARFAAWCAGLPPTMTAALGLAGAEVVVRAGHAGPLAEGRALVDAWRRWSAPATDRFAVRPTTQLDVLDERLARPALVATEWLRGLDDAVVEALGAAVWPADGSAVTVRAEVRHLAGLAPSVPPAAPGEPTDLLLRVGGSTPSPEAAAAVARRLGDLRRALVAVDAVATR